MSAPLRVALLPTEVNRGELEARLGGIPGVVLHSLASEAAVAAALQGADALVIATQRFKAEQQAAVRTAPSLRFLQLLNAGMEAIPPGALPAGLPVSTPNLALAPTVAEHAVALLLAVNRRLHETQAAFGRGQWDQSPKERMQVLTGATVAIVGYGAIGQQLARRLRGFDCRIIAVTRTGVADPAALAPPDEWQPIAQLDAVLAAAHVVVLTLPLGPQTRQLIDARRLAVCRRDCVIVNVSRGAIIDTAALVAALQSGRIAGAGLDVTDPEPLPAGHPLWAAPNVVLSPHIAAGGGYGLLAGFVAENLARVMRGEAPLGLVRL